MRERERERERERLNQFFEMKVIESVLKVTESVLKVIEVFSLE